jgi:hypothetical protein
MARTSTVVAEAAILPLFRADQLSSSLSLSDTVEPVFLGENRVLVRRQSAIGHNQSGVTRVFAQLNLERVILGLIRAGGAQARHFHLRFGQLRRLRRRRRIRLCIARRWSRLAARGVARRS